MKHLSKSSKETSNLAKLFAQEVLKTKPGTRALAIGFTGELGAGKTTFIKSFLRALGVTSRIVSPTFIFSRRYKTIHKTMPAVWHFDVYRLSRAKEVSGIGLKESLKNPGNLVLIEWADKIKSILPEGIIWVELKHGAKPNERHITFNRR